MTDITWGEYATQALSQLSRGAFLNTAWNGQLNTMTISWGQLGVTWGKPIFTVLVRPTRHTYTMLEPSGEFTVSIPAANDLDSELALCGSTSGRDGDKFAAAGLHARPGRVVAAPSIEECELHYECRVVYRHTLQPDDLPADVLTMYPARDFHTVYLGEIVAAYRT